MLQFPIALGELIIMQQTDYSLEVHNLTFSRSTQELFRDLNFSVANGAILQIIGANGVGKTTLLRIVAGLLPIEQGEVYWCGNNIHLCMDDYNEQIAYLGHHPGISLSLTPLENLRTTIALHVTLQRSLPEILDQFNLTTHAHIPTVQLSAGLQRRVALACLVLRRAKLWILDEPLAALDKAGSHLIEQLIADHVLQGGLAIITTHQSLTLSNVPMQRLELDNV